MPMYKRKKSKYNAKKTYIDGFKFDSKVESKYYLYLKDRKAKGEIKDFELQPSFTLQDKFKTKDGKTIRSITYIADFKVVHNDGSIEIIDVKGDATDVAKIKRKMFLLRYPDLPLLWVVYDKGWVDYFSKERDE
jgi:hypothetical protein